MALKKNLIRMTAIYLECLDEIYKWSGFSDEIYHFFRLSLSRLAVETPRHLYPPALIYAWYLLNYQRHVRFVCAPLISFCVVQLGSTARTLLG